MHLGMHSKRDEKYQKMLVDSSGRTMHITMMKIVVPMCSIKI